MSVSREVLSKYITPGCAFMESGSRWGLTLLTAASCGATKLFGCEADKLIQGIADVILEEALANTNASLVHFECQRAGDFWVGLDGWGENAVLFLDAHTESHSPIMKELEAISKWEYKPRVILIDDVRCWESWGINNPGVVADALRKIGIYDIKFEDGVVPGDVMVAVLTERG